MEAVALNKPKSHQGLTIPISVDWPKLIDDETRTEIFQLMNRVLEKEDTIGFPGPLSEEEGRRVVNSVANAVEEGSKYLMLLREQEENQIVGHLILTPSALPNCRHVAEISRVFVHPEYRGLVSIRIGLREVLDKCERIGIETLTLDVRANTRIHKLWQAFGFDTIGVMQDYARVDGVSYAGCYMYQSVAVLKDRMTVMSS